MWNSLVQRAMHLWLVATPLLTGIGALSVALGVLNLLFARRSQVDSWCNAHPRVAAILKLSRGLGHDPWQMLQAAALWLRGRLPDDIERIVDFVTRGTTVLAVLLACAFAMQGCTGAAVNARAAADTAAYCQKKVLPLNGEYALELAKYCYEYAHFADCPAYSELKSNYEKRYVAFADKCADESVDAGAE